MTENIIALVALTAMEIVLGIDNIVFIVILTGRLPERQRLLAQRVGLALAMITRILLLFTLSWILGLDEAFFEFTQLGFFPDGIASWLADHEEVNAVSCKDLILLAGGLFLIGKSVVEIHEKFDQSSAPRKKSASAVAGFTSVVVQILFLDIVFSLDSVITAVGMARNLWVMVVAIVIAVGVMLLFAGRVSRFVEQHPTLKMLALSFLILIGVMLVAEGIGTEIDKGYIYFAMGFALVVEFLNIRIQVLRQRSAQPAGETISAAAKRTEASSD